VGEQRDVQQRVDAVEGGVPETVRNDHVRSPHYCSVGTGDALVGDLEPAVSLTGDRADPQPTLIDATDRFGFLAGTGGSAARLTPQRAGGVARCLASHLHGTRVWAMLAPEGEYARPVSHPA
jgi:hypothetical protein